MLDDQEQVKPWGEVVKAWMHPKVITMLFLGFSAGIPILLIFSTLSAWLREAGLARSAVTFFSWAGLGYSFKFVWAPLVDRLPLPILSAMLGRRRSWILVAQMMITGAILWMGSINPAASQTHLTLMACAAVLLGFSSATQDIVIDAYRIECADKDLQAMLSATYIAGYRIAMIVAGAGCLTLADFFGTSAKLYNYQAWRMAYYIIACFMLVGMVTTLITSEPDRTEGRSVVEYTALQYGRFFLLFVCSVSIFVFAFFHLGSLCAVMKAGLRESMPQLAGVAGFVGESTRLAISVAGGLVAARCLVWAGLVDKRMLDDTYIDPVRDFFSRYGLKSALLLLFLVGFYRISDIVLGVISMVFYVDLGYSKTEIAVIAQTFGIIMTIVGGFLGGMLTVRYSVKRILMAGAVLASATNILFMILANVEPNIWLLKAVIAADNLAGGMASAAFVAFLSGLTSISFTAMQYAIFSSLMTLFPKLLAGYSGTVVDSIGYSSFFLLTALIGAPVIVLIWLVRKVE